MPELPEVEAARRAIADHCVGKKIKRSVVADDSKVIDGVSPSDFQASLLGKTIVAAHRKGKNMWLQLDSPPFPSFQFGMAGAIYIKGVAVTKYKRSAVKDTDEWPSKYSKLFIELDDGLEMSFTDKRRFAKVRLLENPASAPPISELGPDALLQPMTTDELFKSLCKKKIGIKALLLDQSYISGIGNWIADEVLYQARIHPLQVASSISKESCEALHNCIKEVIRKSVEVDAECSCFPLEWLFHNRWGKKPGKVIEKAVEVGADSSEFPSNWIFHSREKKPGKAIVDGKKIEFITAGGRTTAFVPELQKLSGGQAAKAPAKPRKGASKTTNNKDGEDDGDEERSEDEEKGKDVEPKGRKTASKTRGKKRTKKSIDSEDENDDEEDEADEEDEKKLTKGSKTSSARTKTSKAGKKPAAKRKAVDSDDDGSGGDDYEDQKKVTKKKQNNAEKAQKTNQTVPTGKQPKRRAR